MPASDSIPDTRSFARSIRLRALRMVHLANASHIGSCLSMADLLAVLYSGVLRHDPKNPRWEGRDRLLLSKGHAGAILYAALAERGFFDTGLLEGYCKNGQLLQGHLSHHVPGVELSTGSLGHALGVGCGMAVSDASDGNDRRTFVIVSDGELDEGSNWEAILFAGHQKLANLTCIVDYNKIQSFGSTRDVLDLEPLADKWRACRWHVTEIDGHDIAAVQRALTSPSRDAPSVVIAHTVKGKGVSYMENTLAWHYRSPSAELLEQAIREVEAMP